MRWYDPYIGRFLTRDPIGIWGDPMNLGNGTAYVGNNPWSYVDPYGLCFQQITDWMHSAGGTAEFGPGVTNNGIVYSNWGKDERARVGVQIVGDMGQLTQDALVVGAIMLPGPEDAIIAAAGGLRIVKVAGSGVHALIDSAGKVIGKFDNSYDAYKGMERYANSNFSAGILPKYDDVLASRLRARQDAMHHMEEAGMFVDDVASGVLRRPRLSEETKRKILERAPKTSDGKFIDPITNEVIDGPFDIGHRPGFENWKILQDAYEEGLSQEELNMLVNRHPEWFIVQKRRNNRCRYYEQP